jgi:hypothetical protein
MIIHFIFIFDALYVTLNLMLFSPVAVKEGIMLPLILTLLLFVFSIFFCILFQVDIVYYMMQENNYERVKSRLLQFDYFIMFMFLVNLLLCFFLRNPFDIFLYISIIFYVLLIFINGYLYYENEDSSSPLITVEMV